MKFVKLFYIDILEDFCVLYYIKVTKLVRLAKFGHFEDFSCTILHKSREV